MGSYTITLECKAGVPMLTVDDSEPRGDVKTTSQAVSREIWETLWKQLEGARWRSLEPKCVERQPPSQIAMGITDLDLEITDGNATKTLKCLASDLTTQHEAIMAAFDKAAGVDHDDPS